MEELFSRILDEADAWARRNGLTYRADDQSTVFVRNLVEQTLTKLYERKFEKARWLNDGLVPISTEVNEGADTFGYQEIGDLGEADIISEAATDFPMADIEGDYTIHKTHPVGTSFRYTTHDVRKARLQGRFDIVARKSAAARRVWDKKIDDLIIYGSKKHGFDGLSNAKNIRVDNLTTGDWATATAAQILADLDGVYSDIVNTTDGNEVPDTFVMPIAIYRRLSTLNWGTASDISILDYLKKAFPEIKRWAWNPKLSTAAADGTDAAMLYTNSAESLTVQIPMPLRPLAPEQRGATFVVNLESRYGGLMVPMPLGISRFDNI